MLCGILLITVAGVVSAQLNNPAWYLSRQNSAGIIEFTLPQNHKFVSFGWNPSHLGSVAPDRDVAIVTRQMRQGEQAETHYVYVDTKLTYSIKEWK